MLIISKKSTTLSIVAAPFGEVKPPHFQMLLGVLFSKNNSDLKTFMHDFRCHATGEVIVHTNN